MLMFSPVFLPKETKIKATIYNSRSTGSPFRLLVCCSEKRSRRTLPYPHYSPELRFYRAPNPQKYLRTARQKDRRVRQSLGREGIDGIGDKSKVKTIINPTFVSNKSLSFLKTFPDVYIILTGYAESCTVSGYRFSVMRRTITTVS